MKILISVNKKGGVGKSTIAREVAAAGALRGLNVLMVDADPQANLTESWVDPEMVTTNLAHVLIPNMEGRPTVPLSAAVIETQVPNLDLVGCDSRLAAFNNLLGDDRLYDLRMQLEEHATGYDLVVVDCTIYAGSIQSACLFAADFLLIPAASLEFGLSSLADLAESVQRIRRRANPGLQVLGVVMNLFKPRRKLSGEVREAVESKIEMFGFNRVLKTNIHDYNEIAQAPGARLPVGLIAPGSSAARQIEALADEIFELMGLTEAVKANEERSEVEGAEVSGGRVGEGAGPGTAHAA